MERITTTVRIYKTDCEILKRMHRRTIADSINILLNGRTKELKEVAEDCLKEIVKAYMEEEVNPYIKNKMEEIKKLKV